MAGTLWEGITAHGPVTTGTSSEKKEDIEFLLALTGQGKLKVVIDRVYELDDIVSAHRHADTGKKIGNIVIRV